MKALPLQRAKADIAALFPFVCSCIPFWFNITHMADDQVYSIIRSSSIEFLSIRDLAHEVILNGKLRISYIHLQCNVVRDLITA